jgi:hypothetical protein
MGLANQLEEAIKKVKLTAKQQAVFDGLSKAAKRLLNDMATSRHRGGHYHGGASTDAARSELEKHKLITIEYGRVKGQEMTQPLAIPTKKGKKFMAYALYKLSQDSRLSWMV